MADLNSRVVGTLPYNAKGLRGSMMIRHCRHQGKACNIMVQFNGPQGPGQADFPITVEAPGAIPIWRGWLIALRLFLGVVWLIRHQYR